MDAAAPRIRACKALGNSMAVSVMRRLAERMLEADKEICGAWLEFQAAWMTVQEIVNRIAVKDMEEG